MCKLWDEINMKIRKFCLALSSWSECCKANVDWQYSWAFWMCKLDLEMPLQSSVKFNELLQHSVQLLIDILSTEIKKFALEN